MEKKTFKYTELPEDLQNSFKIITDYLVDNIMLDFPETERPSGIFYDFYEEELTFVYKTNHVTFPKEIWIKGKNVSKMIVTLEEERCDESIPKFMVIDVKNGRFRLTQEDISSFKCS